MSPVRGRGNFAQAGIELVILRAASVTSVIGRIARAMDTLSGKTAALAAKRVESSKAYKESTRLKQSEMLMESLHTESIKRQLFTMQLLAQAAITANAYIRDGISTSIEAAKALEYQSLGVVRLGRNLDYTTSQVENAVEAVKAQTFTSTEAYDAIGKLTSANLSLGEAAKLAAAANDIAAVRGRDAGEVYKILTQSVANGTVMTLRQLEITESMENAMETYGRTIGKTTDEMDQQDRVMSVLQLIYRKAKDFTGAYAAAQDTLVVKQRELAVATQTLREEMGERFLPVMKDGVSIVLNFVKKISALPDATKDLIANAATATTVFLGIGAAVGTVLPVIKLFGTALAAAFGIGGATFSPVALVGLVVAAVAIGGLTAAFAAYRRERERLAKTVKDTPTEELNPPVPVLTGAELIARLFEMSVKATEKEIAAVEKDISVWERRTRRIELGQHTIVLALRGVADEMYRLDSIEIWLDKKLKPAEYELMRIEAQQTLILIPLQRQERVLQRQYNDMQDINDAEQKRLQHLIKQLEKRIEAARAGLEVERDRLSLLNHEMFMEDMHNRILKQVTSGHALELRGQRDIQADILAQKEKEFDKLQKEVKAERERLDQQQEIADTLLLAAEKRLKAVQREIELQQEKVTFQQEELQMEQARQVEGRIYLMQQRDILAEITREYERQNTLLGRQADDIQHTIKLLNQQLSDLKEHLEEQHKFKIDFDQAQAALESLPMIIKKGEEQIKSSAEEEKKTYNDSHNAYKLALEKNRAETSKAWDLIEKGIRTKNKEMIREGQVRMAMVRKEQADNWNKFLADIYAITDAWIIRTWNQFRTWIGGVWNGFAELAGGAATLLWNSLQKGFKTLFGLAHPKESSGGTSFLPQSLTPTVRAPGAAASTGVVNNYNYNTIVTNQGPSIDFAATYSAQQSPGSVRDDLGLLLGAA